MANSTYSFLDVTASFVHPEAGAFIIVGQTAGAGQFTIVNAQDRTTHNVAADGSVMINYIAGDNGSCDLEVQQTSPLHQFLLNWYNIVKTNADLGNVSLWAAATVVIRSMLDGSTHTLTGVSPTKVPDKVYGKEGANLTWRLMAASVINE